MTLVRRILAEKRAIVLPLGLALLANAGVYALAVYPLQAKSAGAAGRAAAAARQLTSAEQELANARALVASKSRADEELARFYQKVLPADLPGARSLTYARLPALARKTNVKYEERKSEVETGRDSRLGRLKIRMVLQGDYGNLRQFIFELETAPEFVIIDGVTLTQADTSKPLTLTLDLSTYYRLGAHGA